MTDAEGLRATELRERVMLAIAENVSGDDDGEAFVIGPDAAQAAILAVLDGLREPTGEMVEAFRKAADAGNPHIDVTGGWRAMIDCAKERVGT